MKIHFMRFVCRFELTAEKLFFQDRQEVDGVSITVRPGSGPLSASPRPLPTQGASDPFGKTGICPDQKKICLQKKGKERKKKKKKERQERKVCVLLFVAPPPPV